MARTSSLRGHVIHAQQFHCRSRCLPAPAASDASCMNTDREVQGRAIAKREHDKPVRHFAIGRGPGVAAMIGDLINTR